MFLWAPFSFLLACFCFGTKSHVPQADLNSLWHKLKITALLVFLPPPPKRWDYQQAQPQTIYAGLETTVILSVMLGKQSSNFLSLHSLGLAMRKQQGGASICMEDQ